MTVSIRWLSCCNRPSTGRTTGGLGPRALPMLALAVTPWAVGPDRAFAADEPWALTHVLVPEAEEFGELDRGLFGSAIALHGEQALVGAPDAFRERGVAFVFHLETGEQVLRIASPANPPGGRFGFAVALNERWYVIGAPADSSVASASGAVHFYDRTTARLHDSVTLVVADGQESLGIEVLLEGEHALGSGPGHFNGIRDHGAVYRLDRTTEGRRPTILPDVLLREGDYFGSSIAISGNRLLVGASGRDTSMHTDAGAAWIIDVDTGATLRELIPDRSSRGAGFGTSVACVGDRAIVGAGRDTSSNTAGVVYIFNMTTGEQRLRLLPDNRDSSIDFGRVVAAEGGTLLVSAPFDNSEVLDSGSVARFDLLTGEQFQKFRQPEPKSNDRFGWAVAIQGHTAVIGMPWGDLGGPDVGVAYVYRAPDTTLSLVPAPLRAGEEAIFTLSRLRPAEPTWLLYSVDGLDPGGFHIPGLNVHVDLIRPQHAWGPKLSGTDGTLVVEGRMPALTSSRELWFQGVQHDNVTSTIATRLEP